MIKKIKSSLFLKVFLLTATLLVFVSLSVFGILAIVMPSTYSAALNDALDVKTRAFISELEKVTTEQSGELFDQFVRGTDISYIEIYNKDGLLISTPGQQNVVEGNANEYVAEYSTGEYVAESGTLTEGSVVEALPPEDAAPTVSNNYYFSFADSNDRYMMVIYTSATQVSQMQKSFLQVFPFLLLAIIIISLVMATVYAKMITKPVLKISKISQNMSDLSLDWNLEESRSDELGLLEKKLNELSKNLKQALTELQNANIKLENDIEKEKALEKARSDFFSAVSHELKTPITVVKGQLEGMILGVGTYKDRDKYLSRSLEVTNVLDKMVGEIVTISRLESSTDVFRAEQFDIALSVREYLSTIEDIVMQKELQMNVELPHQMMFTGNKLLIEKVFSNIIGNAVLYSPASALIKIQGVIFGNRLKFSIMNTGTQIPNEAIPHLFDAFYRVDKSRSRKTGGSGLGLYIVQKVLMQYQSNCTVENTDDGVEFTFVL